MKTFEDSLELAQTMVDIGENCGRKMAALITDMNVPTGYAIGNSLEVMEAVDVLKGGGPADLRDICLELSANMVHLATDADMSTCRDQVRGQLENGAAFETFVKIIQAQGGDTKYLHDTNLFEKASILYEVIVPKSGYIAYMNAENCGLASCMLGAGRGTVDDVIDYSAGIVLHAKTGDFVKEGDVLATFHTNNEASLTSAEEVFLNGFEFTEDSATTPPLIYARVTKNKVEKY